MEAGPAPAAEVAPTPAMEAGSGAAALPQTSTEFGDPDPEHAERLADFGPAWHARNGSWNPMSLGPEGLAEGRVFSIDPPTTEAVPEQANEEEQES